MHTQQKLVHTHKPDSTVYADVCAVQSPSKVMLTTSNVIRFNVLGYSCF